MEIAVETYYLPTALLKDNEVRFIQCRCIITNFLSEDVLDSGLTYISTQMYHKALILPLEMTGTQRKLMVNPSIVQISTTLLATEELVCNFRE